MPGADRHLVLEFTVSPHRNWSRAASTRAVCNDRRRFSEGGTEPNEVQATHHQARRAILRRCVCRSERATASAHVGVEFGPLAPQAAGFGARGCPQRPAAALRVSDASGPARCPAIDCRCRRHGPAPRVGVVAGGWTKGMARCCEKGEKKASAMHLECGIWEPAQTTVGFATPRRGTGQRA